VFDRVGVSHQFTTLGQRGEETMGDVVGLAVGELGAFWQPGKAQRRIAGAQKAGANEETVGLDVIPGRRWELIREFSLAVERESVKGLAVGLWIWGCLVDASNLDRNTGRPVARCAVDARLRDE
jgi:hypothetical protein